MTKPSSEQAASVRRGAAFLIHHGNRNVDGVNAILGEIDGEEQTLQFLMGVATVFETLMPVLYSQAGQWLMQQTVADLAGMEVGEVQ